MLSVFYAIRTVGYIDRRSYDQRKENNVFIVLPGEGGMLGDSDTKVRLLGMPGLVHITWYAIEGDVIEHCILGPKLLYVVTEGGARSDE